MLFTFNEFIKESNNSNSNSNFKYNEMIDYTLLDNNASDQDIIELCDKAIKFGVKSVCVMPIHVSLASKYLSDSDVLVVSVVDFPEGDSDINSKIDETNQVILSGADEVDMVLDYKRLIELDSFGNDDEYLMGIHELTDSVRELVDICHSNKNKLGTDVLLKVIVESGLLSISQTDIATNICINGGADFIKTSTGKVSVGAEVSKVKEMKEIIDDDGGYMEIKVSGGIRTLEDIEKYYSLGATRFGIGYGSVDILNGLESENNDY